MKIKEEKFFLYMMCLAMFLIILLTPPMTTPDEETHFTNIYAIGYGKVLPKIQDGTVGRTIPANISDFIYFNKEKYTGKIEQKYSYQENYGDSWSPNQECKMVFKPMGTLATLNPAGYFVASLGIMLGRIIFAIFGHAFATPYNLLLFARIANAIFYITCGYFALCITPILKRTMLLLLMMPMSLYLGVSVSYDSVLISVSILFFANVLRMIFSKQHDKVTIQDIVITMLAAFFLVGIKMVYAPFLLLLCFIPKQKFGSQKKYYYCIAATIGTAIIALILYPAILHITLGANILPTDPKVMQQRRFLASHLYLVPSIIWNSIKANKMFYMQSFFGNLGQLDTNFPIPILVTWYSCFVMILGYEIFSTPFSIQWKFRISNLVLSLLSLTGIFIAMYLNWTPYFYKIGERIVTGVQGRYFIPLFLFLCFNFANSYLGKKGITRKGESKIDFITRMVAGNSIVLTCFILLLRFWIS